MKKVNIKLTPFSVLSADYSSIHTLDERKRIVHEIMKRTSYLSYRLPGGKLMVVTQTVEQRKALDKIIRKAEKMERNFITRIHRENLRPFFATNSDGMKTIVFANIN